MLKLSQSKQNGQRLKKQHHSTKIYKPTGSRWTPLWDKQKVVIEVLTNTLYSLRLPQELLLDNSRRRPAVWPQMQDLLDFPLTLAIGISYWRPGTDEDIETTVNKADQRMYEDKKKR